MNETFGRDAETPRHASVLLGKTFWTSAATTDESTPPGGNRTHNLLLTHAEKIREQKRYLRRQ